MMFSINDGTSVKEVNRLLRVISCSCLIDLVPVYHYQNSLTGMVCY